MLIVHGRNAQQGAQADNRGHGTEVGNPFAKRLQDIFDVSIFKYTGDEGVLEMVE